MSVKNEKNSLYDQVKNWVINNRIIVGFALPAFLLGVFLTFAVPPFFGYDESHHFYRAYQLSRFEYKPAVQKVDSYERYGSFLPTNVVDFGNASHDELALASKDPLGASNYEQSATMQRLLEEKISKDNTFVAYEGALVYSPVGYTPTIMAIWLGELMNINLGSILVLARLFNILAYILLCVLAIKILPNKFKLIMGAIAMMPMAVFQASSISVDGMVVGLCLVVMSAAIRLLASYNKMVLWIAMVSSVLLALTKPTYLPISMITPLVYLYCSYRSKKLDISNKMRIICNASLLVLIIFLPMFMWYILTKEYADNIKNLLIGSPAYDQIDSARQISTILSKPWVVTQAFINSAIIEGKDIMMSLFGRFTWDGIWLPLYAVMANIAFLLLVAPGYDSLKALSKNYAFWLLTACVGVAVIVLVFMSLYVTFNEVGALKIGWVQGRYLLPILPLLILPLFYFIRINITTRFSQELIYLTLGPLLLLHAAAFYGLTFII
jgi:uncharacterized membrane protein